MRSHRDLEVVAVAAVASAVLGLSIPVEWLSFLLAAPLFFVLPGYALASLAFARRSRGLAPLLALTLGLSLAVLAVGSLLLNFLPGGLRAGWWAALLVLVTVGACRGAALRRPRNHRPPLPTVGRPRLLSAAGALIAAGAVLSIAAIALAFVTFKAADAVGYTELWIQPLPAAQGVRIGVGSQEQERISYRLEVEVPGKSAPLRRKLALDPGQARVIRLPVESGSSRPKRVVATLYKTDEPNLPYRRVNAWVGEGAGG